MSQRADASEKPKALASNELFTVYEDATFTANNPDEIGELSAGDVEDYDELARRGNIPAELREAWIAAGFEDAETRKCMTCGHELTGSEVVTCNRCDDREYQDVIRHNADVIAKRQARATVTPAETMTYDGEGTRQLQAIIARGIAAGFAAGEPAPVRWTPAEGWTDHTTQEAAHREACAISGTAYTCPECETVAEASDNYCGECGHDISTTLAG